MHSPTALSDIAKHLFPAMLARGSRLMGHVSPEYIKDVGTPERLDKVERDIDTGVVERLSGRSMRPAVFLDRDGTLNREVGHLCDAAQLELLPGVGAAVRRMNQAGHLAVAVTNQPVVHAATSPSRACSASMPTWTRSWGATAPTSTGYTCALTIRTAASEARSRR